MRRIARTSHDRAVLIAAFAMPVVCAAAEFDITRYGAKPDGATDCSPAIRAAIADASKAGGGRIVIPAAERHYVITDSIHLTHSHLHLSGAGATVFLKDGSDERPSGSTRTTTTIITSATTVRGKIPLIDSRPAWFGWRT